MESINSGTDHTLTVRVKGTDGLPIDLNGANDITVKVYQKRQTVLASFTLNGGTLSVTDAVAGVCVCRLNRSSLTKVVAGKLFAEVIVDMVNMNFSGGVKRSIQSDILLGVIKLSV